LKYLSKFLLKSEYTCRCCDSLPPDFDFYPYEEFFDIFDDIREEWGKPIIINSGYRCPEHNSAVGGSPLSAHCFGLALDCDCEDDIEVEKLFDHIDSMYPVLRIGKYKGKKTFVHIDVGYEISPRPSLNFVEGKRW